MNDSVIIYNRSGEPIADLRTSVKRSWILNKIGKAEFNLSYTNANYNREDVLEFGNFLVVKNPHLPDWVGILETPRKWGRWEVSLTALSAENLLTYHAIEGEPILSGTAGAIYSRIIRISNAIEPTILREGEINIDGKNRTETLTPADLYTQIKSLAERAQNDFDVTPIMQRGKLSLSANWYLRLGRHLDFVLSEGRSLAAHSTMLNEQGRIKNYIRAYGDGATAATRPTALALDNESRNKYGLRKEIKNYSGVSQLQTLTDNAQADLRTRKEPRYTFNLNVLNNNNAWTNLRLGNNIGVELWSVAFGINKRVKIVGMEYDPQDGYVDVTADTEE